MNVNDTGGHVKVEGVLTLKDLTIVNVIAVLNSVQTSLIV